MNLAAGVSCQVSVWSVSVVSSLYQQKERKRTEKRAKVCKEERKKGRKRAAGEEEESKRKEAWMKGSKKATYR